MLQKISTKCFPHNFNWFHLHRKSCPNTKSAQSNSSSPPKKAFVHMVSTSPALFVPSNADARRSPLTDVASQRGGAAYAHVEWRRNWAFPFSPPCALALPVNLPRRGKAKQRNSCFSAFPRSSTVAEQQPEKQKICSCSSQEKCVFQLGGVGACFFLVWWQWRVFFPAWWQWRVFFPPCWGVFFSSLVPVTAVFFSLVVVACVPVHTFYPTSASFVQKTRTWTIWPKSSRDPVCWIYFDCDVDMCAHFLHCILTTFLNNSWHRIILAGLLFNWVILHHLEEFRRWPLQWSPPNSSRCIG